MVSGCIQISAQKMWIWVTEFRSHCNKKITTNNIIIWLVLCFTKSLCFFKKMLSFGLLNFGGMGKILDKSQCCLWSEVFQLAREKHVFLMANLAIWMHLNYLKCYISAFHLFVVSFQLSFVIQALVLKLHIWDTQRYWQTVALTRKNNRGH